MENILENLKKYFRETPREEVLKGWQQAKREAPKGGPKLNDFLCLTGMRPSQISCVTVNGIQHNHINPKKSSGFVFLYRQIFFITKIKLIL